MRQSLPLTAALTLPLLLLLLSSATTTSNAHNITRILAKHPEFSTFNHYLTVAHLAAEINRRLTITVLAVDNAGMASLISKHLSVYSIKNVLSLHVLVDYFGSRKLHQLTDGTTLSSSMFQASGSASGTSGYVNITNLKAGKVGFGVEDNGGNLDSFYVKSVKEIPYNISILQVSKVLSSAEAEAPVAGPSELNVTTIMRKQGCKAFADLLVASGADPTFEANIDGGLTVFCPTDTVINGFMPKYKNLTAPQKISLWLYHGIPVYQSLQMLKTSNGVINTLATDKANKYDFTVQNDDEDVTVKTKVVTAKVIGTLIDEEPVVVYKIDKVLLPRELFKVDPTPPAPAPKARKKKTVAADAPDSSDADADAPEADSEDQTAADDNGTTAMGGGRLVMVFLSLWVLLM